MDFCVAHEGYRAKKGTRFSETLPDSDMLSSERSQDDIR